MAVGGASGSDRQRLRVGRLWRWGEFDGGLSWCNPVAEADWPRGGVTAGLWWLRGGAQQRAEVTKLTTDAARGEALLAQGALPGQALVCDEGLSQPQLGVGQHDECGPAVGLCWVAHPRGSPAQALFGEAEGVLNVEAVDVVKGE